jgi:hypothetical protein
MTDTADTIDAIVQRCKQLDSGFRLLVEICDDDRVEVCAWSPATMHKWIYVVFPEDSLAKIETAKLKVVSDAMVNLLARRIEVQV